MKVAVRNGKVLVKNGRILTGCACCGGTQPSVEFYRFAPCACGSGPVNQYYIHAIEVLIAYGGNIPACPAARLPNGQCAAILVGNLYNEPPTGTRVGIFGAPALPVTLLQHCCECCGYTAVNPGPCQFAGCFPYYQPNGGPQVPLPASEPGFVRTVNLAITPQGCCTGPITGSMSSTRKQTEFWRPDGVNWQSFTATDETYSGYAGVGTASYTVTGTTCGPAFNSQGILEMMCNPISSGASRPYNATPGTTSGIPAQNIYGGIFGYSAARCWLSRPQYPTLTVNQRIKPTGGSFVNITGNCRTVTVTARYEIERFVFGEWSQEQGFILEETWTASVDSTAGCNLCSGGIGDSLGDLVDALGALP